MGARVLVVGGGGREHAVAWKLSQSPDVDEIVVAPGNAGTATLARNVPVQPKDIDGLVRVAKEERIDFYLASMDDPQALGLVDRLTEAGVQCFGPTADAARIESSKAWSKAFMVRNGVRTAAAATFTEHGKAVAHVRALPDAPLVVKASGLALGKGAIMCNGHEDALDAIERLMRLREFGSAGDEVVIEEHLEGWEASAHAFCDGETAVMMPFATDYKRAQDADKGLNTGGVGAYSPSTVVSDELAATIDRDVVQPTIAAMRAEGRPFAGTLFPGLMIGEGGVNVLEYNARWGDPEAQVLLPRLETDLFAIAVAGAEGRLGDIDIRWSDTATVGVVLASGGYPATYKLGHIIEGIDAVDPGVHVFHAGTKDDPRGLVTNGGRVLCVVARGKTVAEARAKAYDNAGRIHFTDVQYRRDIAAGV